MDRSNEGLIEITADIVAAHVSNNNVAIGELPALIQNVYRALEGLTVPAGPAAEPDKPKRPVTIRASIKPDHLVSMIDGKSYRMLKRHLSQNGYTPESYRQAFDLPADYPMVASDYSEQRRAMAKKIGLGRKRKTLAPEPEPTPSKPKGTLKLRGPRKTATV